MRYTCFPRKQQKRSHKFSQKWNKKVEFEKLFIHVNNVFHCWRYKTKHKTMPWRWCEWHKLKIAISFKSKFGSKMTQVFYLQFYWQLLLLLLIKFSSFRISSILFLMNYCLKHPSMFIYALPDIKYRRWKNPGGPFINN